MSKDSSKRAYDFRNIWPWVGVVTTAVALYGSQFVAGLVLVIGSAFSGASSAKTTSWLNNSTLAQFLFVLLAEALAVGIVYLYLKFNRMQLTSIGLRRPKLSDLGWAIAVFLPYLIIYFIIVAVLSQIFPGLNINEKQEVGFNSVHGAAQLVMALISLVVLPPIAEEIMFRGLLYKSLKSLMPLIPAAITTSLLFAAGHLTEGANGLLYIAAIDTFTLSLFLIYLREKTDGLYASMTLHALKNGLAFIVLFVHLSL